MNEKRIVSGLISIGIAKKSIGIAKKSNEERLKQYHICKERGHIDNGVWYGEWTQCKFCETLLKYETIIHEKYTPDRKDIENEN